MQLFPLYQNYSFAGKSHFLFVCTLPYCRYFPSQFSDVGMSFIGVGSCDPPRQRGEYFDIRCLGPEQKLKPGQVSRAHLSQATEFMQP